jgi:transcriptional regulator GlxA family with amidase domain
VYGTPPGRWLLEKRLETARRLLEVTDKPVADVVLESGFKNNAHFSKAFKNHFKISPLQCRRHVTLKDTVQV